MARVDLGKDALTPCLCYCRPLSIRERLTGRPDARETFMFELLSMHPGHVLKKQPRFQLKDIVDDPHARAVHAITGVWGEQLTRELALSLGASMKTLVRAGLTWEDIASSGKSARWLVDVTRATRRDFDNIPGNIRSTDWTQEDVENALR